MESSLRQRKKRALRDKLSARKLLKVLAIIPFMWNYRKEYMHRLLEENYFAVRDSDVLHPIPVNYYLFRQKNEHL